MLNSYTLEVYKKQNKPCFVITLNHIMRAGIYFFNSLPEANAFIVAMKNDLLSYAELKYNQNGVTDKKTIEAIKTVLHDNDLCIGENGKTYSKIC